MRRALEGLVAATDGGRVRFSPEKDRFTVEHRGLAPLGKALTRTALAPVVAPGLRKLLARLGRRALNTGFSGEAPS